MKRAFYPLLVIAMVGSATAQPPVVAQAVITAPASVPAGGTLVLYGDKSTSAGPLAWKLISPRGAFLSYDQGDRKNILVVIPNPSPGTYKFALVATGSALGSFDFDLVEVIVESGPGPGPGPGPTPTPPVPPAPTPLTAGFIVTLVTDSGKMTPALASVRDSVTLGSAIGGLGGRYMTVDIASAEYFRRNLGPHLGRDDMAGKSVVGPAIVIQDKTGKVIAKAPAPADEAGVIAFIKSIGGN